MKFAHEHAIWMRKWDLGRRICYLQLQITILSCFCKHKGPSFQFDHLIYFSFYQGWLHNFFSCENEQGLFCLTCEWSEKHLTTFQNAFRKAPEVKKIRMLIKALEVGWLFAVILLAQ